MLQEVLGIQVSKATARRMTLATGQAQLAVDEAEQQRLTQEVPPAPAGAEKQAMSGDGAMVHLVGGEWVEVLSRDFDGIGKKAIHTDTASSAISSMAAARSSANFSARCKDW